MAGSGWVNAGRVALGAGAFCALAGAVQAASAPAYDFAYRLSGDRRVAPLQVFDDGQSTWMQFHAGQALPAIFAQTAGATRLVPYVQQGPYVVLEGTVGHLSLRIGDIVAQVEYAGAQPRVGVSATEPASSPQWTSPIAPAPQASAAPMAHDTGTRASRARALTAPAAGPADRAVAMVISETPDTASTSAAMPRPAPQAVALHFDAGPTDQNMRRVLGRWAREAGWVFDAEHWSVDVDIPLTGSAAFGGDFRQAVRGLLGATELGERPLQPCFYANQVLRVVPMAQPCNRTMAPAGADPVRS